MGAPECLYDALTAIVICERVAQGETIKAIAAEEGFPSWPTVCKWLASETDFAIRYARARAASAEALEHKIIQILDDPAMDPHDKRVRADGYKWIASKRNPRVYGEKLDLSVSGSLSIVASLDTSRLSLEELQVLESLLAKARKAEPITIENNRAGDNESPHNER